MIAEHYTDWKTNLALRRGLKLVTCGMSAESNPLPNIFWPNIFWIVPERRWFKITAGEAIARIIAQRGHAGMVAGEPAVRSRPWLYRVCWLFYPRRMRASNF
jgi:hypothetical protein